MITMTRGFRPDPLKEHAALTELAALQTAWREAEFHTVNAAREAINDGVRSNVIADALGMNRATLYRWMRSHGL